MEQEKHRSIAELWDELSGHLDTVQAQDEFLAQPTDGDYDPYREAAAKDIVWREGKIGRLRAKLLERCKQITSIYFEVMVGVLVVTHKAKQVFWKADAAREMSAAYAFWAWELEQRANEAQKGGQQG